MFIKKRIATAILILSSTSVMANEEANVKFYGNIQGDIGDFDYSDSSDRVSGSYVGVSFDGYLREKFTYKLNLGVSHTTDLMKEVPDLSGDDIEFDINEAYIRHYYSDNLEVDFGRVFTPIGFYNDDPLGHENLFNGSNSTNKYTDGLKTTYKTEKNDLDFRVDGFIGVRLDNSFVSSLYGINFDVGNDNIGHFSTGYMYTNFPGEIFVKGFQGSLEAKDGAETFVGYLYSNEHFAGTIQYKNTVAEDVFEIQDTYLQLRYKTDIIEPYVEYSHTYQTVGEESSWYDEYTMDSYTIGAQLNYSKNLSFYGEGERLEFKESNEDEDFYRIGLKFEY